MKRLLFVITFLSVLSLIAGCGSDNTEQRSTFYSTFSIADFVAENDQYLLPESRVLSGTEAGPNEPPYQRHEEMIVQIDPVDVPQFMEALKADTQQAIIDSGARIDGQGGSFQDPTAGPMDYISFRYSQDEINGIINLYGVRGEGSNYTIIMILTEN